jgi:hypothetical protein
MMRRAVFLLAALLVGAAMAATTANAKAAPDNDDYGSICSALTVSDPSPTPGETVTVSGDAASPNASIAIVLGDKVLGTTTTDSARHFSTTVTIPADANLGTTSLQAFQLGDSTDPVVGCPAQVLALEIVAPAVAAEPLARTGSNSTLPLARLGFGLLAAGGMAVLVGRRRRNSISA